MKKKYYIQLDEATRSRLENYLAINDGNIEGLKKLKIALDLDENYETKSIFQIAEENNVTESTVRKYRKIYSQNQEKLINDLNKLILNPEIKASTSFVFKKEFLNEFKSKCDENKIKYSNFIEKEIAKYIFSN